VGGGRLPQRRPGRAPQLHAEIANDGLVGSFSSRGPPNVEKLAAFLAHEMRHETDPAPAEGLQPRVGDAELMEAGPGGVGDAGAEDDRPDPGPVDGPEAHGQGSVVE